MEPFPCHAATTAASFWSPRQLAVTIEGRDGARADILVNKPFARVGRDRRAEVPLSGPDVLPCHLYLHATDEGIYCAGLANGAPSGWLREGTPLEVGPFRLHAAFADGHPLLQLDDPQAKESGLPPFPQLRVFWGKSQKGFTDVMLHRQLTLVGRQSPASWRVKHPTISRAHCAFVWDGRELWLIDLFSSNGTRLGATRFDAGVVPRGQEFSLGTVRLSYLEPIREPEQRRISRPVGRPSRPSFAPDGLEGRPTGETPQGDSAEQAIDMSDAAEDAQAADATLAQPAVGQTAHDAAQMTDDERIAGDSLAHSPMDSAATPEDGPSAALVETRLPFAGDTKFVEPQPPGSPRSQDDAVHRVGDTWEAEERELADERRRIELKLASMEECLAALLADAAAQKQTAVTSAARSHAELASAQRQIARLEAELSQQRQMQQRQILNERQEAQQAETKRREEQRRFAGDVKEELLTEIAELRRQTDLVRQEIQHLTVDFEQAREALAGCRGDEEKLAALEATMTAKIVELRAKQDALRLEMLAAEDRPAWRETARDRHEPAAERVISVESLDDASIANGPPSPDDAAEEKEPDPSPEDADKPEAGHGPEWLANDVLTQRLLSFQAKRARTVRRRRLQWTAVAVALAALLLGAAGAARFWMNHRAAERTAAEESPM